MDLSIVNAFCDSAVAIIAKRFGTMVEGTIQKMMPYPQEACDAAYEQETSTQYLSKHK